MAIEEARKVAGKGPQVGPAQGQGGFTPGSGGGGGGRGGQGSGYNSIFVGSKGYMGTSGRGEGVGLLPGSRWAEYKLPDPYLQRSPGASSGSNHSTHARDWVRACKGGAPACSNFSIAGPWLGGEAVGKGAFSMVPRTPVMVCKRRPGSFCKQCRKTSRTFAGVFVGKACQSGSRSNTAAIVSSNVAPANARLPVSSS